MDFLIIISGRCRQEDPTLRWLRLLKLPIGLIWAALMIMEIRFRGCSCSTDFFKLFQGSYFFNRPRSDRIGFDLPVIVVPTPMVALLFIEKGLVKFTYFDVLIIQHWFSVI